MGWSCAVLCCVVVCPLYRVDAMKGMGGWTGQCWRMLHLLTLSLMEVME
jgi:hypothetical protein